jgi:hypothetical protein
MQMRKVDNSSCLFCSEHERISHMFSECASAQQLWEGIAEIMGMKGVVNYEFYS